MSQYYPDAWVLVCFDTPTYGKIYKILAAWYGGYLGSDSWKLSSGVVSISETESTYEVHNDSGSVYVCPKSVERFTGITASVYSNWQEQISSENSSIKLTVVSMEDYLKGTGTSVVIVPD